jgi:hypothetical protein
MSIPSLTLLNTPRRYAKIHQAPIGQRCWHLFVRLSRAEALKPILRTGNASQPGRPCAILTGQVSTFRTRALTDSPARSPIW